MAALFGAMVGIERERKNQMAGLRTYMLVCVGSALTIIVSAYGFMDVLRADNIVLDPSRIAAQVISGIGFIGAGTILFLRPQGIVKGLTTAAGLWAVAAIGLATGAGMYFAASVTTVLAIIILFFLQLLESRFLIPFKQRTLKITTSNGSKSLQIVNDIFQDTALTISSCTIDKRDQDYTLSFLLDKIETKHLKKLINDVQADDNVQEIVWK